MEKPIKKYDDAGAMFLYALLQKADEYSRHVDNQTNVLVSLCTAIFVFSASIIETAKTPAPAYWFILAMFSIIAAIIGLFALHPPRFMAKGGQKESYMYSKNVAGIKNAQEYVDKLLEVVKSDDKITEQYAMEVYNIYKYYYRPKRTLFKISRFILVLGLFLSFLLFLASFL